LRGGITTELAAGNVGATLAVARGRGERFFAAGGMTTGGLGPAGDEGESLHRLRRNVKKTCLRHVFSSDRSGCAARREPRGTEDEILRCAQNDNGGIRRAGVNPSTASRSPSL
jgi:hypothetical protein